MKLQLCRCTAAEVGRHDDDVEDSPLLAMFKMEERRRQQSGGAGGAVKKDVPHLSFRITSDDGFHVESDSLTSNNHFVFCLFLVLFLLEDIN